MALIETVGHFCNRKLVKSANKYQKLQCMACCIRSGNSVWALKQCFTLSGTLEWIDLLPDGACIFHPWLNLVSRRAVQGMESDFWPPTLEGAYLINTIDRAWFQWWCLFLLLTQMTENFSAIHWSWGIFLLPHGQFYLFLLTINDRHFFLLPLKLRLSPTDHLHWVIFYSH